MIRSVRKAITTVANSEVLADVVTGASGYSRKILSIWFEQVANRILRGYIDTDRVVDVHSEVNQADFLAVPVEAELAEGQTFKIGFLDESGAGAVQDVVVFYEESST
jgi:hypothetical protein